jgi:hypothetical protein
MLQFCATIKRMYKDYKQILENYCKNNILPKARKILNSACLEYKFGNFKIKIDKKLNCFEKIKDNIFKLVNKGKEDLSKIEDWLEEEESVEENEGTSWGKQTLDVIEEENEEEEIEEEIL